MKASRVNVGGKDGLFVFPLNSEEFALRKANHRSFDGALPGPTYRQLYTLDKWPTQGEMLIRIRLAAANGKPHVTIGMGYRASGAVLNVKPIGETLVNGSTDSPQVFEYRIRMEEVPVFLSGKPKFRGEDDFSGQQFNVLGCSARQHRGRFTLHLLRILHPVLAERAGGMTDGEFAEATLRKFVPLAYRRPVSEQEYHELMALYTELQQRRPDSMEALRDTLAVVLSSPHFLYVTEPRLESESRELNAYELGYQVILFPLEHDP